MAPSEVSCPPCLRPRLPLIFILSLLIFEVWLNPLAEGPPSGTCWVSLCLWQTCPGVSAACFFPARPPFTGVVAPRAPCPESPPRGHSRSPASAHRAHTLPSAALMKPRVCRKAFDATWPFRHDAGSPAQFLELWMQDPCRASAGKSDLVFVVKVGFPLRQDSSKSRQRSNE